MDPTQFVLSGARLVLPDRVAEDSWLAVVDGRIAEIGYGRPPERGFDLGGDLVLPGLVELHTDHLEAHYTPRPAVHWHALSSVLAYDAQISASGITTVFDSLRAGAEDRKQDVGLHLEILADAIEEARSRGLLRAEHRTHLRCEISAHDAVSATAAFVAKRPVHLMSLMDHTPGQRQFRDLEKFLVYYRGRTTMTEAELAEMVERRIAQHADCAVPHRRALVDLARRNGIKLASHDDATLDQVDEALADGVSIAEFPTTLEAARASHQAGIAVLMGAPNLVRGGSHSGNVAAEALARAGHLDVLSSDYVPCSLLQGAFELPRRIPAITLPEAVAMVTRTPAHAVGLEDRGELRAGLRADLVRVQDAPVPVVRSVWREGRRVL
jgi:alpha-D-ribose 1-methylphosphonate 5-triphosphate diphosphatase